MKIKTIISTCFIPLAFAASAALAMDEQKSNFVAVKLGYNKPMTSGASFTGNNVNNTNYSVKSAKDSAVMGIEFGAGFMDRFTASFEYNYYSKSKFTMNSFSTQSNSYTQTWSGTSNLFLANLAVSLYEHSGEKRFNPYVKAGLGVSKNKASDLTITDVNTGTNWQTAGVSNTQSITLKGQDTSNFAWRVGLGTTIMFNHNIDFDLAYAYTDRGKFKASSTLTSQAIVPGSATTTFNLSQQVKLRDNAVTLGVRIKL